MGAREHDPGRQQILEALQRHDVQFVVIGGAASQSRGWEGLTADVDVTPARDPQNLERLATALTEIDARFRVDEERYPRGFLPPGGLDARTFTGPVSVALSTQHGHLDICLIPDGFPRGYEDLIAKAELAPVAMTTTTANIADASDILHSKTMANRQKDRDTLPELRAAFLRAGTLPSPPGIDPATIAARDTAAARRALGPKAAPQTDTSPQNPAPAPRPGPGQSPSQDPKR